MIAQPPPFHGQPSPPYFGPPQAAPPRVLAYAVPHTLETVPGFLPGDGAWRDGDTLVVRKMVVLPDRCVKCNAPADSGIIKANLHWHHPMLYLLILPGLLVYAIAAMALQQSGSCGYRLCARHRQNRLTWMAVAWGLGLGGIVLIGVAAAFELKWLALAGAGTVFCSPFVGLVARTFRATKIDAHFMWLRGAHSAYLAAFPPLPQRGGGFRAGVAEPVSFAA